MTDHHPDDPRPDESTLDEVRLALLRVQRRKAAAGIPDGELRNVDDHRGMLTGSDLLLEELEPVALAVGRQAVDRIAREPYRRDALITYLAGLYAEGIVTGVEVARIRDERATGVGDVDRAPYIGDGADGARRSAQIDREEAATLADGDPRRDRLLESAARWERQATRLERADG